MKRIGILTGGGDVPGLNACIKTVALHCADNGIELLGIRRGWQGVVDLDPRHPESFERVLVQLTPQVVRTIDRYGGTMLHSSRTNPSKMKEKVLPAGYVRDEGHKDAKGRYDLTPRVLQALQRLQLEALVVIGGDDTLSYAARLDIEGFPTVGIPKTMDNDVTGTHYCIGFSTAVTRSVDFITGLRTPAGSHERIAIVELFGRNSGETSLLTGYLAGADRVLISEVPFDVERVARFAVQDQDDNPSHYCVIVVSEGAFPEGGQVVQSGEPDAYGHRKLGGIGEWLSEQIRHRTGRETLVQKLGYLMRAGSPDSLDRLVAINYGNLAFQLLQQGRHGVMAAIVDGCYTAVPLQRVTAGPRAVDIENYYDREHYRVRIDRVEGAPMFLA